MWVIAMYKILIVDDEIIICKGMIKLLNWQEYGFEIADYALHGADALEKLASHNYDLVMTDVRMPVLDGIALVKKMRELNDHTPVVIISGYNDFAYAQAALEFGVTNYLLKPVGEDEIIRVLKKVKTKIENSLHSKAWANERGNVFNEKQLVALMDSKMVDESLRIEMFATGVKLDKPKYQVLIVHLFIPIMRTDKSNAFPVAKKRISDILDRNNYGYVFELSKERLGVLLKAEIDEPEYTLMANITDEIWQSIVRYARVDFIIGIGQMVSVEEISNSYNNACKALDIRIYGERNRKVQFNERNVRSKYVWQVITLVRQNYAQELNLKHISDKLFVNPVYLGQIFKQITSINFIDYVNRYRIEMAAELLKSEEFAIYEVSEQVGYKDKNYFTKMFKKIMKTTPTEYRRKVSINN